MAKERLTSSSDILIPIQELARLIEHPADCFVALFLALWQVQIFTYDELLGEMFSGLNQRGIICRVGCGFNCIRRVIIKLLRIFDLRLFLLNGVDEFGFILLRLVNKRNEEARKYVPGSRFALEL